MSLQRNRLLLVLPESGEHGLTERSGEERYHLTEAFGVAEMGLFKVEASTVQPRKEGLKAPPQAVVGECHLGAMVGRDNQKLAILKPSGDDVDPTAPDSALAYAVTVT